MGDSKKHKGSRKIEPYVKIKRRERERESSKLGYSRKHSAAEGSSRIAEKFVIKLCTVARQNIDAGNRRHHEGRTHTKKKAQSKRD